MNMHIPTKTIEGPLISSGVRRWENDADIEFAALNIDDIAMSPVSFALEVKCDARRTDAEILDSNCLQECREMRIEDGQFAPIGVWPQPE
jgi:hypothetical protein